MTSMSSPLYRIMPFHHVVQLFESNTLYFSNPSMWPDPFETRLKHEAADRSFAQCWCSVAVSDAMWRMYSPNHLGVRISTTRARLNRALASGCRDTGMTFRTGDVTYLSPPDLDKQAKSIHRALKKLYSAEKAADVLFLKRAAFTHEREYRLLITVPAAVPSSRGIPLPVDPHALIRRILIDPRAPGELADALIYYFKRKLAFDGEVRVSTLYKAPTALHVA